MAKQTINIGTVADDGTGSTIRVGGDIINDNFNELYTKLGDGTNLTAADFVTDTGTFTLESKTIDLTSNTLVGTTAEFNAALSDGDFTTLDGSEILTNKTINGSNNTITNLPNSALTNPAITFTDGSTSTDINLGGTVAFSGTSNAVEINESSGTLTFSLSSSISTVTNITSLTSLGAETISNASGNLNIDSFTNITEFLGNGSGSVGAIKLNCEQNTHGQTIVPQPHVEGVTNTLTLPAGGNQELVGTTDTQELTNKTINLSQNTLIGIGNEVYNVFSDGTVAPGTTIADGNPLLESDGTTTLLLSIIVSNGFSKVKVEWDGTAYDNVSTSSEAPITLQRKVNSGSFVDVRMFTVPANDASLFGRHFMTIDSHGASMGDTVQYRLINSSSANSYGGNGLRQYFGVAGDTFTAREV
jgi:hypothetical protein